MFATRFFLSHFYFILFFFFFGQCQTARILASRTDEYVYTHACVYVASAYFSRKSSRNNSYRALRKMFAYKEMRTRRRNFQSFFLKNPQPFSLTLALYCIFE